MKVNNRVYKFTIDKQANWLETISASLKAHLDDNTYPLRFSITDVTPDEIVIESTIVTFDPDEKYAEDLQHIELLSPRRRTYQAGEFGVAQIVPTGIRCELGGFAGDAGPATNLLASVSDFLVTHPNAVNASELNEMAENVLYVEGKSLDDFLLGHLGLLPVRSNKIGTFVDPTGLEYIDEVVNTLNAARAVKGVDCSDYAVIDQELGVRIEWSETGCAVGTVLNPTEILDGVEQLLDSGAQAIGGISVIHGVTKDMFIKHLRGEIPNPSGGIEAIITHLISKIYKIPTAHAPLPYYQDVKEKNTSNPRASAEFISTPHYFCVLKGLHRAPQLVSLETLNNVAPHLYSLNNIGAIVTPADCLGGIPALVAEYNDIPLIAVKENATILDIDNSKMNMRNVIEVNSYLEAAGVVVALREGISLESLRRPLHPSRNIREASGASNNHAAAVKKKRLLDNSHRNGNGSLNGNTFPLSFNQQRLWFLNQLEPDSSAYNISKTIQFDGELDIPALHRALNEITTRHEPLRTIFKEVDGSPRQIVLKEWKLELDRIDLRNITPDELETERPRLLKHHIQRPFNLQKNLMLRTVLFQLSEKQHILLIVKHHIASDGWSMELFLKELYMLYEAFSTGKSSPLPALPMRFSDYTIAERKRLQGTALEELLSYWQGHLNGAPAMIELPTDRPRTSEKISGARETAALSPELVASLQQLSRENDTTLFNTLFAAFFALLYRYCRQEEIVVGMPIANRAEIETEALIGFIANTLPIKSTLDKEMTFRELLSQVKDSLLDALSHQGLPFEKLVEAMHPDRGLGHNPLFQVMFILLYESAQSLDLPDLKSSYIAEASASEQFDLTMVVSEKSGQMLASLTYNKNLFETATIQRMLGHFQILLGHIAKSPDAPLTHFPIITSAELQSLASWNSTEIDIDHQECIHHLFEKQAAKSPEAIAVISGDKSLTYQELNSRANQLANYLQKKGVKPESLVGIYAERSFEMMIGLLGILKAGGAYVPLDPTYPKERLAFIAENAAVSLILTHSALLNSLPQTTAEAVLLDTDWPDISQESSDNPTCNVHGDNPAYIMYTSGSTGKPKGVVVLHKGVHNYLLWRRRFFPLNETDRILQKTTYSFVDSVWEIFEPLMVGAQMIMAEPDRHQDTMYLAEFMAQHDITAADFIPSQLWMLMEEPAFKECKALRRVTTGSEVVSLDLQEKFFTLSNADLYNLYGPTEASIAVTCWKCQRLKNGQRSVPIGRPISNMQIHILDEKMQPVPVGLPGELYLGGIGLAREYLGRPELSAENLLPIPSERQRVNGCIKPAMLRAICRTAR